MKLIPSLFLSLLLFGCDRSSQEAPKKTKEAAVAASEASTSSALSPDKTPAPPERLSLIAAEFHSELAEKGLAPAQPVETLGTGGTQGAGSASPELQFTRLAGAKARYCATLSSGPIRCWGRDPLLVPGSFVDVAVAEEGYCGVEMSGKLNCEKLTPPPGIFSRIVAHERNYCAVSRGGEVQCFGSDAASPLKGQKASYVTVGKSFACASDPTDRLVCWGSDAPLLPVDPFRVKDIAAGSQLLCYLKEDGSSRCLGRGPRLPDGKYTAVSAGYGTVCGVAADGSGRCFGSVEVQTKGPVRQLVVAETSVCAHRDDGRIECWGDNAEGQLVVPTEARLAQEKSESSDSSLRTPEKESQRVEAALWLEFLELFPSRDLPLTFDEKQDFDFGDRIPAKFAPLTGQDPNRFRAGIGVPFAYQIVGLTLFDLEERVLLLHLYQERRLAYVHELLRWDVNAEPPKERPDGTTVARRTAILTRSLVTTEETIEVSRLDGKEEVVRGKSKADGTRDVTRARCDIDKKTYVLRLLPDAKTRKEGEKVGKDSTPTENVDCGARLPFRSL